MEISIASFYNKLLESKNKIRLSVELKFKLEFPFVSFVILCVDESIQCVPSKPRFHLLNYLFLQIKWN